MSPHSHGLATEVVERIRVMRPGAIVRVEADDVVVLDGKRLATVNLAKMIEREPERRDQIMSTWIRSLVAEDPAPDQLRWVDVRDRIMPRIVPAEFVAQAGYPMPRVEFVSGTAIVFVLDKAETMSTVSDAARSKWRVSVDDLMVVAVRNLAAIPCTLTATETIEGGYAAAFSEADGYDAARLLLPSVHELVGEHIGRDFYAAIPARDTFIAFSNQPPALRTRLQATVDRLHASSPYPITPRLFVVTRDGVAGTEKGGMRG